MNSWLLAMIIVLFFEGMMISVNPEKWQEIMRQVTDLPPQVLRRIGLVMISVAFLLLFLMLWK